VVTTTLAQPQSRVRGWVTDFLNYLGRNESERDPNAKIKLLTPATEKVLPEATKSARLLRR